MRSLCIVLIYYPQVYAGAQDNFYQHHIRQWGQRLAGVLVPINLRLISTV
jgi:hypothetical protein